MKISDFFFRDLSHEIFKPYFFLFFLLFIPQQTHASGTSDSDGIVCKKCNILLLNIDFLRTDFVGTHNQNTLTPNIDKFFRNGIIFKNIYSPSGSTYRGNLSVFTATNPFFYKLDVKTFESLRTKPEFRYWRDIYTSQTSLAEKLKANGYQTVMLNKGTRSGKGTLLDRGFSVYKQFPLQLLIEDQIDHLFEVIDTTPEPFFIHFHAIPTRLHRAFYPIRREKVENKNIIYIPYELNDRPYGYKVIRNHGATVEQQRQVEHTIYQQQLIYADQQLKRIFDRISSVMDNTIVILLSTHGTQIGDKGVFASNGVSYESNIRVPLMIKAPGIEAGRTVESRFSLLDFVPSILELLDISHEFIDGSSLFKKGNLQDNNRRLFIAGYNDKDSYIIKGNWKLFLNTHTNRSLYKVVSGQKSGKNLYDQNIMIALKMETAVNQGFDPNIEYQTKDYIFNKNTIETPELYNLSEDPFEEINLASRYPDKTSELLKLLHQYRLQAKSKIDQLKINQ